MKAIMIVVLAIGTFLLAKRTAQLDTTTKLLRANTAMLEKTTKNLNSCLDARESDMALTRSALDEVKQWKSLYDSLATNAFLQAQTNKFMTVKLNGSKDLIYARMIDNGQAVEIGRLSDPK
jgi:hypothetical protein